MESEMWSAFVRSLVLWTAIACVDDADAVIFFRHPFAH